MKKILGLDLGTNSIGWALINQDTEKGECKVIKLGSRIIPMSEDVLGKFDSGITESNTAARTGYRGIRRLRERHLLRRERLHRVLNILQFLPAHYAEQIDFKKRLGQFLYESEPKIAYRLCEEKKSSEFIFKRSFDKMMEDFKIHQPTLIEGGKKVPYDWTIYFLRKKALTEKIEKEELAWLLLNFNQKRGYYQLRGEEDDETPNKLVEFHSLKVIDVIDSGDKKGKDEIWYNVVLENGWIYRRTSKTPLEWKGKVKEFIVTTDLNEDGTIKVDKYGAQKRSFRSPSEDDWTLVKKRTEFLIERSKKTVGTFIYDTLLQQPHQKIKGSLVKVIERKYYKDELRQILATQQHYHAELQDKNLYKQCLEELYSNNESHKSSNENKDFVHLFLNDIIFYQRPLKSKKSSISDCKYECRTFVQNGEKKTIPIKCIARSHPLFQEFRIWQWMRNLAIYEKATEQEVTSQFLKSEQDWVNLFEWLNDRKDVDHKALLNYLVKPLKLKATNYRWNYVYDHIKDESKSYPCNKTRSTILSKLGKEKCKDFLTQENEIKIWELLYSVTTKEESDHALSESDYRENKKTRPGQYSIYKLLSNNGFTDDEINALKSAKLEEKDYGAYSSKAIRKLLPLMRLGKYWNESAIDENTKQRISRIIHGEYDETLRDRVRDKTIDLRCLEDFKGLPLWLTSYIVYDRHSEDGEMKRWKTVQDLENYLNEFKQHSLRNPIVEQVITETLRVVKEIWKVYGNGVENFFNEIHVELGREMKSPKSDREQITKRNIENENTNLRIKALLAELANDHTIENVRPYSQAQQEILKIYEEGALNAAEDISDEILKISKTAQPSKNDLIRYKLWLEQKYMSPYTGAVIPLNKLFTPAYEIEHIIPQSRHFDDSFSNKVICEAEVNKLKGNKLGLEFIKAFYGQVVELSFGLTVKILTVDAYERSVKEHYSKSRSKMQKLLLEEIPDKFVERQLNDTRYISKVVKNLLSNIVRAETRDEGTTSNNLLLVNGQITSTLRQDWGLNDVWNEIITPRFERLNALTGSQNFGRINENTGKFLPTVPLELSRSFSKKRIDHRHHALDALVIACTTRNHINYLNNQSALEKKKTPAQKQQAREDLRAILCYKKYNNENEKNYKWVFKKPWDTVTQEAKEQLLTTLVSFKQNLRVINKTVNKYERWSDVNGIKQKVIATQTTGDSWAIRKPMHKDTVSGLVRLRFRKEVILSAALSNWESIVNNELRKYIKGLVATGHDKKMLQKHFKENGNLWGGKDVSKVEVFYWDKDNVASRVKLDESFTESKIKSITDIGIQKILLKHLNHEKYQNATDAAGKQIAPESLAFSADGLDELNKNIRNLNGGKFHQPIIKVRTYEPKGNKFNVGQTGNKKDKFVEAAKGTNLFFAVYKSANGKRSYKSLPFNEVVENQKISAATGVKPMPVPPFDENGDPLLFVLSPNDLVFLPSEEEKENPMLVNIENLSKDQLKRVYKIVSFTGNRLYGVPLNVSKCIIDKVEFTQLNKLETSLDNKSIKEYCWKLQFDRLGKIVKLIK